MFYGNYRGYFHGGEGGLLHKIRLYNGDRIVKVTGRAGIGPGADIDQLTFHTRRLVLAQLYFNISLLIYKKPRYASFNAIVFTTFLLNLAEMFTVLLVVMAAYTLKPNRQIHITRKVKKYIAILGGFRVNLTND